jgi:hypothetical protein
VIGGSLGGEVLRLDLRRIAMGREEPDVAGNRQKIGKPMN